MKGRRDRFTRPADWALGPAEEEVRGPAHRWLGTEHLPLGLPREEEGVAAAALRDSGLDLGSARRWAVELVGPAPGTERVPAHASDRVRMHAYWGSGRCHAPQTNAIRPTSWSTPFYELG